jgi:hypothetical protein
VVQRFGMRRLSHSAAMRCQSLAIHSDQSFEGREADYNRATKLMRLYSALVEALKRYRSKCK